MSADEIREHIQATGVREAADTDRLAMRINRLCWPGGFEDRSDRAALEWLRFWRPERLAATLPDCSCATGRCKMCN